MSDIKAIIKTNLNDCTKAVEEAQPQLLEIQKGIHDYQQALQKIEYQITNYELIEKQLELNRVNLEKLINAKKSNEDPQITPEQYDDTILKTQTFISSKSANLLQLELARIQKEIIQKDMKTLDAQLVAKETEIAVQNAIKACLESILSEEQEDKIKVID